MSWARCLSLLLAAALGAGGVLTVQHFTASEKSPPPATQSVNDTVQLEDSPPPEPKRVDEWGVIMAELGELTRVFEAEEARRPKPETQRQRLERAAERRHKYKQGCVETLRKILRLAEEGDLAYIPVPLRAEIRKAIDSDNYYILCRAFNAMIAVGIVAPAYEIERGRWSGNLDEPWLLLAPRVRDAIERHKQAGGTVRILARSRSFP